jgi:serine/threonine protein kinase/Tol biopolymer transport system component
MDAERWRRIEALYHAADGRPRNERTAFLCEACAGDEALAREVLALLDQPASAGAFFAQPAAAIAAPLLTDESAIVGQRVGVYQIVSRIGAGGMGEVYRARDSRLGREVAIKILPRAFTSDPERLARFEREARVLASLNHPNIATIHGVEDADGAPAIVMELVDGETLADRLASLGASHKLLPVREALAIARQVADGLDAAHEKGIVHRDLKPANIAITNHGSVKVLDFGLAKTVGGPPGGERDESTLTVERTADGLLLGTVAYMSPEQARGQAIDKRTDIWAFGCVVYEMLTGRQPFAGETSAETFAAILERDPDWSSVQAAVQAPVFRMVRHCLEKDANQRLRDIADARIELGDPGASNIQANRSSTRPRPLFGGPRWLQSLAIVPITVAVAALAAVIVIALAVSQRRSAPITPITVEVALPAGSALADPGRLLGPPVVSPDGNTIAVSLKTGSTSRLFIRRLDSDRLVELKDTDGAAYPAWSADGGTLSFFADDKLKAMPVTGGVPVTLCAAPSGTERGAAWAPDGSLIFGLTFRGVFRCPKDGGPGIEVTRLDASLGENSHRYPVFLPDSRRFLYYARTDDLDRRALYLASLDPAVPRKRIVVADGQFALGRDPASGGYYLVTQQASRLIAQRFDVAAGATAGPTFQLLDHAAQVSTSNTGVLVQRPESQDLTQLAWFDRSGHQVGTLGSPTDYWQVELSPDDTHVAAVKHDYLSGSFSIWIAATAHGDLEPFSASHTVLDPIWLPDNTTVIFDSGDRGQFFRKRTDSSAHEQSLDIPTPPFRSRDVSPDGRLLIAERRIESGTGIFWAPLDDSTPFRQLGGVGSREEQPHFSPDGHLVAFVSNRTSSPEVYVAEFPQGRTFRISSSGGQLPRWRADGKELFYVDNGGLLVSVDLRAGLETPKLEKLFQLKLRRGSEGPLYDVTSNGQRFIAITGVEVENQNTIGIVLNWPGLIRR